MIAELYTLYVLFFYNAHNPMINTPLEPAVNNNINLCSAELSEANADGIARGYHTMARSGIDRPALGWKVQHFHYSDTQRIQQCLYVWRTSSLFTIIVSHIVAFHSWLLSECHDGCKFSGFSFYTVHLTVAA